MVDNGNFTESNYGDTPYPDDGSPWMDAPTSNQVLAVEETEETVTMPSGMIPTGTGGPIVIRTEEAFIVICVMILWVAAIALFFNRWGKIRMLEPYQPKFHEEEHRPSCPMVELANTSGIGHGGHRTSFSKFNVNGCLEPSTIFQTCQPTHRALQIRPRQNSMFAGGGGVVVRVLLGVRQTRFPHDAVHVAGRRYRVRRRRRRRRRGRQADVVRHGPSLPDVHHAQGPPAVVQQRHRSGDGRTPTVVQHAQDQQRLDHHPPMGARPVPVCAPFSSSARLRLIPTAILADSPRITDSKRA